MRYRRPLRLRRAAKWFLPAWFALVVTAAWVLHAWKLFTSPGGLRNLASVEFWAPVAFVVIALLLLWLPDRRRPSLGHCLNCGYNLTGNESGVCPECATPVPKREATA